MATGGRLPFFFLSDIGVYLRPPLRFKSTKQLSGDFFGPATPDCPTILIRGGSSGISKSVVEPSLQPPPRPDPTRSKISHPTERDIRQLEFDGETAQSAGPKNIKISTQLTESFTS